MSITFNKIKFLFDNNIDRKYTFYYKQILDALKQNDKLTVEYFMKKLDLDERQARRLLYRLFDLGLITYENNNGKNYWQLKDNFINWVINREKEKKLNDIKEELDTVSDDIYFRCKNCKDMFNYLDAYEFKFQCPLCGKSLVLVEDNRHIKSLKKKLEQLSNL